MRRVPMCNHAHASVGMAPTSQARLKVCNFLSGATAMSLYFPTDADCAHHTIFPGVTVQTCSADKMMLCLATLKPHSVVEEHSHPHEQVGIVIEGRLIFH